MEIFQITQDNHRISKSLIITVSAESLLPCKVSYSVVPRNRAWMSLEDYFLLPTGSLKTYRYININCIYMHMYMYIYLIITIYFVVVDSRLRSSTHKENSESVPVVFKEPEVGACSKRSDASQETQGRTGGEAGLTGFDLPEKVHGGCEIRQTWVWGSALPLSCSIMSKVT